MCGPITSEGDERRATVRLICGRDRLVKILEPTTATSRSTLHLATDESLLNAVEGTIKTLRSDLASAQGENKVLRGRVQELQSTVLSHMATQLGARQQQQGPVPVDQLGACGDPLRGVTAPHWSSLSLLDRSKMIRLEIQLGNLEKRVDEIHRLLGEHSPRLVGCEEGVRDLFAEMGKEMARLSRLEDRIRGVDDRLDRHEAAE